ncbi:hypothetical protein V8F06_013577 [Rhypophila decipiens]
MVIRFIPESDVVLSKKNANEVNFYAPRADKLGDNFAALIEGTGETLDALVRTIKAEMGPETGKLIALNFAILSEDEHHRSEHRTLKDGPPTVRPPSWRSSMDTSFNFPPVDNPDISPFQDDSVLPPIETPKDEHALASPAMTTTAGQSSRVVLQSLMGPNIATPILSHLLQKQWPPFGRELANLGPDMSTLGCFVTVYRNILRSVGLQVEVPRTFQEVFQLGPSFKGTKRRMWEYLWLDMNFPSNGSRRKEFMRNTNELIAKLKISMAQDSGSESDTNSFTFKEIVGKSVGLAKLWQTVDGLRLFRSVFYRHQTHNPWNEVAVDTLGYSSAIEYDLTQLAATARLGTVFRNTSQSLTDLNSERGQNTLETIINKKFQLQSGEGPFASQTSYQPNVRATCAFPAAIRVHYRSKDAIPNDVYTTDWLTDGPGRALRSFSILQERWNVSAANLQRRKQEYRLMAVVRMRNIPEELDLVRIYSGVGECILPLTAGSAGTNLVYSSGSWSLSEPNREFMLYYTPCAYNAQFPPAGINSFPERYANVD